ncbi:hypothetical protein [Paenibacillus oleatilyticus]|uniref:Rho termination factor N-terminal domain-containing protein n=1 Tax=Paenibacillus oleatilyticus TaxID=2594886 RepID=A0ABV4UT16_9BACL
MAKIFSPNTQYTGLSASILFVNGVGETSDPNLLEWFRDHGYIVEEETTEESVASNDEPDTPKPIEEMTLPELKEYAEKNQIDLKGLTKKDDILAAIQGASNGSVSE